MNSKPINQLRDLLRKHVEKWQAWTAAHNAEIAAKAVTQAAQREQDRTATAVGAFVRQEYPKEKEMLLVEVDGRNYGVRLGEDATQTKITEVPFAS